MLFGRALGTTFDITLDSNITHSLSPIQNTTDPSGNPTQILYQVANLSSSSTGTGAQSHRLEVVVHTEKGVDGRNVFESFFSFDYASVGVDVDADPYVFFLLSLPLPLHPFALPPLLPPFLSFTAFSHPAQTRLPTPH